MGFIQPSTVSEELFVHLSAFLRDGTRPPKDEMVFFKIDPREDGKKRAVHLMRHGSGTRASYRPARRTATATRQRPAPRWVGWISLLLLGVIGYICYAKLTTTDAANNTRTSKYLPDNVSRVTTGESPGPPFHCDGRKRCSQMTSCAEATFFIKQCPARRWTEMVTVLPVKASGAKLVGLIEQQNDRALQTSPVGAVTVPMEQKTEE